MLPKFFPILVGSAHQGPTAIISGLDFQSRYDARRFLVVFRGLLFVAGSRLFHAVSGRGTRDLVCCAEGLLGVALGVITFQRLRSPAAPAPLHRFWSIASACFG